MEKNFVVFKNPYLRYRKEEFGGIAKIVLKTFILNRPQYSLISKIKKIIVYEDLEEFERKIVNKLIEEGLLLKVDLERARELGFK
jgi:isopentenyl diphosphate isomerase/L-lactate dehydrogenase-like FMN-dependent dehydrogenase